MKKIFLIILLTFNLFSQEKNYTILISFDGFRWDYLDRGLTPNIDKLISNGVRANTLKPCFPSKTFPNHYSIVTGQYPENHGIIENTFTNYKTNKTFKISDSIEVSNPAWYKGEAIWETARNQNKITASYFWPGSELSDVKRQPNYFEHYEHTRPYEKRIKGIIDWLNLPKEIRPEFLTLYFDLVDTKGHIFGPNSPEVDSAISESDKLIKLLIDELTKINLINEINIVIVSDHGMSEIYLDKIINLKNILNGEIIKTQWHGPNLMIEVQKDKENILAEKLKSNLKNCKIYLKNEIPSYFHFSKNELINSILVTAEHGYSLSTRNMSQKDSSFFGHGTHGYDNYDIEMHGIFIASGPSFKKNYKIGTIENIDIYPMLCKILKIKPNKQIDGKIENIEFILN